MACATDLEGRLFQNLIDAGYTEDEAKHCLTFAQKGQWKQLQQELRKQRAVLLSTLHQSEQRIDCLDFLVYEINKTYITERR